MTDVANRLEHPDWTFLTNHAHVLHCIFRAPGIRIRDVAEQVLITERAVQRIVVDLEREGYLQRERVGRQNQYRLDPRLRLRHPLEHHVEIGRLLTFLQAGATTPSARTPRGSAAASARGRNGVRPRSAAKPISRLKATRRKRKRIAR